MDSHFQPPQPLHRRRARRINKYGRAASFPATRAVRFRHSFGGRTAARLLAGIFELARQVFAGSRRGAASGVAADRPQILRAPRHGPPRPTWKIVAIIIRPWFGVYF